MSQKFTDISSDVYKLLDPVDVRYDGWETETAERKVFYVRGFSWFKRVVLREITEIKNYTEREKEILYSRRAWMEEPFDWDKDFSWKQAYNASRRHKKDTLKFQKAVETIVLCEAAAESREVNSALVYDNMRIQPACSYIHGFDKAVLNHFIEKESEFLNRLKERTGQKHTRVFFDMAHEKKTVTHQLAKRVHYFIHQVFDDPKVGDVDYRLDDGYVFKPSTNEVIDLSPGEGAVIDLRATR